MPQFSPGIRAGIRLGIQRLVCLALIGVLAVGTVGCGSNSPGLATTPDTPVLKPEQRGSKISEVSPPAVIQELRQSLDEYQPQVKILSPKPDTVLEDNQVEVRFKVSDLPLFKDPHLGLGPHLHVFLDDQPYVAVYSADEVLTFSDLAPGSHTLRVFASRPWHESFKNEGAYAQTTFHVFTKTPQSIPDPERPLITYSRPQGSYGAEPIMLDYYLSNAPLHFVAQDDAQDEIADWRIRCTINGESFTVDRWQPLYLKGFKKGKNWLKLEFLDEQGEVVENVFNTGVRIIDYQPGGQDALAKLVRGHISARNARGIVEQGYIAPEPELLEPEMIEPAAPELAAPEPEVLEPEAFEPEAITSPEPKRDLPVLIPTPVIPAQPAEPEGPSLEDRLAPALKAEESLGERQVEELPPSGLLEQEAPIAPAPPQTDKQPGGFFSRFGQKQPPTSIQSKPAQGKPDQALEAPIVPAAPEQPVQDLIEPESTEPETAVQSEQLQKLKESIKSLTGESIPEVPLDDSTAEEEEEVIEEEVIEETATEPVPAASKEVVKPKPFWQRFQRPESGVTPAPVAVPESFGLPEESAIESVPVIEPEETESETESKVTEPELTEPEATQPRVEPTEDEPVPIAPIAPKPFWQRFQPPKPAVTPSPITIPENLGIPESEAIESVEIAAPEPQTSSADGDEDNAIAPATDLNPEAKSKAKSAAQPFWQRFQAPKPAVTSEPVEPEFLEIPEDIPEAEAIESVPVTDGEAAEPEDLSEKTTQPAVPKPFWQRIQSSMPTMATPKVEAEPEIQTEAVKTVEAEMEVAEPEVTESEVTKSEVGESEVSQSEPKVKPASKPFWQRIQAPKAPKAEVVPEAEIVPEVEVIAEPQPSPEPTLDFDQAFQRFEQKLQTSRSSAKDQIPEKAVDVFGGEGAVEDTGPKLDASDIFGS